MAEPRQLDSAERRLLRAVWSNPQVSGQDAYAYGLGHNEQRALSGLLAEQLLERDQHGLFLSQHGLRVLYSAADPHALTEDGPD